MDTLKTWDILNDAAIEELFMNGETPSYKVLLSRMMTYGTMHGLVIGDYVTMWTTEF